MEKSGAAIVRLVLELAPPDKNGVPAPTATKKDTSTIEAKVFIDASYEGDVMLALCGSWDHAGACRWPHQTSAVWGGLRGQVRVVFVADVEDENHVRTFIDRALASGECLGPDGKLSRWVETERGAGVLSESEEAWGARIAGGQERT